MLVLSDSASDLFSLCEWSCGEAKKYADTTRTERNHMMNSKCKVPDVISIPLLFLVTKTPFWRINRLTHTGQVSVIVSSLGANRSEGPMESPTIELSRNLEALKLVPSSEERG